MTILMRWFIMSLGNIEHLKGTFQLGSTGVLRRIKLKNRSSKNDTFSILIVAKVQQMGKSSRNVEYECVFLLFLLCVCVCVCV